MSFVRHVPGLQESLPAASAINPYRPVRSGGTSSLFVMPVTSSNQRPRGYNHTGTVGASGLNQGEMCTVYYSGQVVKAQAAASLGAGAIVTLASTNGALGPDVIVASGHWEHGEAMEPADAGEFFGLFVQIRKAS